MSERLLEDWLESYLLFNSNTEPPINYHRWCGLSTIAGALQRKCRLDWGSITFYPNLYVILVGPPAARKGTAMGVASKFLRAIGVTLSANKTTEEALIQALAESGQDLLEEGTNKHKLHSSLTILSPELTVFLNNKNPGLMDELTDWFDCPDLWEYRTKHQGSDSIPGVFVNILGATTPTLLRTTLPIEAFGSGFMSRIIFVSEQDKRQTVPVPVYTQEELDLQLQLISDLKQIHALQGAFKVTKTFVDAWIDWYSLKAEKVCFNDRRFDGYIQRRQVHVMSLCMICSASRSNELKLRVEDLDRAVRLLELVELKMPSAFTGIGKNPYADISEAIMAEIATRKKLSFGQLLEVFYQDVDSAALEKIIKTLQIIKYIDVKLSPGGIRNSELIYRGESSANINKTINALIKGGGK